MRGPSLATCLILATAFLAGCATPDDANPPDTDEPEVGSVSSVTIEDPASAAAGETSEVCWRVLGSGNVPHVAIHWDTESHADDADARFSDYGAGVSYPDNTAALRAEGYDIPARFCADVDVPAEGALYIVGHAIGSEGAPGKLSREVVVGEEEAPPTAGAGLATDIMVLGAPDEASAGGVATVCWQVSGTGNVAHVAIHWDNETHAGDETRTFAAYDAGARYPGNASAAAAAGYDLMPTGTRFCANVDPMPDSGSVFLVAHVIDARGAPGVLTDEVEIRVGEASGDTGDDGETGAATLDIRSFAYEPATLVVAPGAVVTVTNHDSAPHTATASGGEFDSGDIPAGGTGTFTAPAAPGSYPYVCAYHPDMMGTLTVEA